MRKFIGVLNALMGLLHITVTAWLYIFVEPRLSKLYASMDIEYSPGYIWPVVTLSMAAINIIFAVKLLRNRKEEQLFSAAILYLVLSFVLLGYFLFLKLSNVTAEIYGLGEGF